MKVLWLTLPIVWSSACGAPEAEPLLTQVVLPWQGKLDCAQKDLVGERLQATLKIGGHDDCALNVDPETLAASGVCSGVTAHANFPLLLLYEQRQLAGLTLPVGYWIGMANLCEGNLPTDGTNDVAVNFINDGVNGALIFTQAEVDALPEGPPPAPSCNNTLADAQLWANETIAGFVQTLDYDCDTESNIAEACNDTLFTEDLSLCN